jgi:mRNA interferase MazF
LTGKIVLIHFPFTDLTSTKLRPALILHEGERDVIVVFISSRIEKAKPEDVLIKKENSEFRQTGLKGESLVRVDKIATLSKRLIVGELGEAGPKLKIEVNDKIQKVLKL